MGTINSKGFTIIEVMMAMVVFAIGSIGLNYMVISSTNFTSLAYWNTNVMNIAAAEAERLMAMKYNDTANNLLAGTHFPDADGLDNDLDGLVDEGDERNLPGNSILSWTVVYMDIDGDLETDAKQITVTVLQANTNRRRDIIFIRGKNS